MGGLWTKETETRLLQDHLDESMLIHLYTNNVTPTRATALASFTTLDSGFLGYAPKLIGVGSWVVTSVDPACLASAPMVVWTFLGSVGPIYGYYYSQGNSVSYPMGAAERFFDGPYSMIRTGQQLSISPVLGIRGVNSWYLG